MNREQKRDFVKKAKAKGISEEYAKAFIAYKDSESDINLNTIKKSDMVMIDVAKIKANKNYPRMIQEYKDFIESSEGIWYEVMDIENERFVCLKGHPKWLFYPGDLIIKKDIIAN